MTNNFRKILFIFCLNIIQICYAPFYGDNNFDQFYNNDSGDIYSNQLSDYPESNDNEESINDGFSIENLLNMCNKNPNQIKEFSWKPGYKDLKKLLSKYSASNEKYEEKFIPKCLTVVYTIINHLDKNRHSHCLIQIQERLKSLEKANLKNTVEYKQLLIIKRVLFLQMFDNNPTCKICKKPITYTKNSWLSNPFKKKATNFNSISLKIGETKFYHNNCSNTLNYDQFEVTF